MEKKLEDMNEGELKIKLFDLDQEIKGLNHNYKVVAQVLQQKLSEQKPSDVTNSNVVIDSPGSVNTINKQKKDDKKKKK